MGKSILALFIILAAGCTGCKNDWQVKELPPTAEAADGMGAVGDFSEEDASVLFRVEVPEEGDYEITVRGRATTEASGTGIVAIGGNTYDMAFPDQYRWTEQTITARLNKGENDIDIAKGRGNGLFLIDYIELE